MVLHSGTRKQIEAIALRMEAFAGEIVRKTAADFPRGASAAIIKKWAAELKACLKQDGE